jgi:energy-coupling factor transporter ATP-binding protein EcfA2
LDGLTLIVGPTNKGKSSIFRSLKGILRNELDAGFVRNGQDEKMEVTLEVDGMPPIQALRTRKGTTKYVIGVGEDGKPKEYKALGDGIPEPMEKLKFGKIKVGDVTMDPIFSEQNKAQFLIDPDRWKPIELNTILGAFASTERLDAGKKEANSRISQHNGEAKTLAEEIREAEERKAKLTVLDGQTEWYASEVASAESTVNATQSRLSNTYGAMEHLIRLTEYRRLLSELHMPDTSGTENLHKKAQLLSQAASSHVKMAVLSGCNESLDDIVEKWESLVKLHKLKRELFILLAIKERKGLGPRECAEKLETLLLTAKLVLSSTSALSTIIEVSDRVNPVRERVKAKDTELARVEEEYKAATEELLRCSLVSASDTVFPKCPKCGEKLYCTHCNPTCNPEDQ